MNIRRWLPRRGSLIVATLAITAATVISPAPASASPTYIYCGPSQFFGPDPSPSGTAVTADVLVTCTGGAASYISLWLQILRDGAVVASTNSIGYVGVTAHASASCVPGTYVVATWGSVSYPYNNIPGSSSFSQQSPSVYIDCVPRPVVAFPGNQSMFQYDSGYLQMTATGATPPTPGPPPDCPPACRSTPAPASSAGLARPSAPTRSGSPRGTRPAAPAVPSSLGKSGGSHVHAARTLPADHQTA